MKKIVLILAILVSGMLAQAQSQTYQNNTGTNFINGQTGTLKNSSIEWTITNEGNGVYKIYAKGAGSFRVKYLRYDAKNSQYIYSPYGNAKFDNNTVSHVLTSGKLSEYAKGSYQDVRTLGILFNEDYGLIYVLKK